MRRSDFSINRQSFNRNHPDLTSPGNFFVDHIWLENDQLTSGVQIIELKSDDSVKSDQAVKDDHTATAWSYSQEHLRHKEQCEINERARQRRRLKLEADAEQSEFYRRIDAEYERNCNEFYTDFYNPDANELEDKVLLNHQMNCFTILDKHFAVNTDSSDEHSSDIENIDFGNVEDMSEQWNRRYDEDAVTYNNNPEIEMEKRTVWIYSFKNKRLLSDNDYEIVNIPSQGTLSSDSTEGVEKSKIDSAIRRVATPIPNSFIPRLSLTPTLPTLTEVTEPKASSSNHTKQSNEDSFKKKPINSWFLSEHGTPKTEMNISLDKPKNVVDWMALSPREKKRRFRIPRSKTESELRVLKVNEINALAEKHEVEEINDLAEKHKVEEINTLAEKHKVEEINCLVEKHNMSSVSDKESQTLDVFTKAETQNDSIGKDFYFPKDSARVSVGVSCHLPSTSRTSNDWHEGYTDDDELSPQDRGDGNRRRRVLPPKLKIRFSPRPVSGCRISDPIQNVNAKKWIGEEREDKSVQTNVLTDFLSSRDDMPSTLVIRNMSLLRPSEWTEYLPIAESMPSLQLSMNTESVEDFVPWYTRWYRFVMRCCK